MLERIDRYILKEAIGSGGQATVYLAYDPDLDRIVAVKVLNQLVSSQRNFIDELMKEAKSAAGLNHPNITKIYDFKIDNDSNHACIVMEYFPNSVDKEILNHGAMNPSRVIEIITQVCDALAYAHIKKIVHRDIKPHNILLDYDGAAKVSDFGVARAIDFSVASSDMGTPLYTSPEQYLGQDFPNVLSDIYSLGVTMYEMVAGHPPFQDTFYKLHKMYAEDPPTDPPDFEESLYIPAALTAIVKKCLEKSPEDRYRNFQDLGLL